MEFDNQKKTFLGKKDKSIKGEIDEKMKELVRLINSKENYYTTSSCSGRIVLLKRNFEADNETEWLFVKHDLVSFEEIKKAIEDMPADSDLWFREEPFIMHVACRTIEDAQQIVNIARESGFRRSGIQATKEKIVVEICSTEFIDAIIAKKGSLLVDDDYVKVLAEEANKRLKESDVKVGKFYNLIKDV